MSKLLIFPSPIDSRCQLTLDNGTTIAGKPDVHSSGRPGQSFELPDSAPNGNGCLLFISKDKYVPLLQRGILMIEDPNAFVIADDFHLALDKVCPEIPPIPPIPPIPNPSNEPIDIINQVYATGLYDLNTKDGCGKFTEACCTQLHARHSTGWGHIRKVGAQNNYNGHAVDAIQLNVKVGNTNADVYDIIISSESSDAKPSFNSKGPFNQSLWYYPA